MSSPVSSRRWRVLPSRQPDPGEAVPGSGPPGNWAAWRRRLDTLRVKLFLAIAGANMLLVLGAYVIQGWSFDQGLVEYFNRADEARLAPLVTRLGAGYREHQGWAWVSEDRERWFDVLRDAGLGRPRRPPDEDAHGPRPPPPPPAEEMPPPPMTFDPRLLLLDATREVIVGPPERGPQAVLKPIEVDGRVVGYLGYVPRLQMVTSLEHWFSAQQSRRFAVIAVATLVAVLLTAALIAGWLARRLQPLRLGAHALARGDYAGRIPVVGQDEMSQLAHDFNRLAEALDAARRLRQQWLADIAHELRTPLATLRAEIEALEDGVRPLSRESICSLGQEVAQLTRLVEDLRLLSQSDLGELSYRRERVELDELIDDALAVAGAALRERGLTLEARLEPGVEVLADAERLTQVLGNLMQNTLRYTEAPGRLEVSLRRLGDEALIVWEDSPPGVPTADLPRLTDRLFRVDDSRARASGGSGLGLAIVKAIVEAHGGRLSPSASVLGGLRWDIVLPGYRSPDGSPGLGSPEDT